jgi:serralysin
MASVTLTTRSGSQDVDGLLSDYQWSRSSAPLQYSFPSAGSWSGYEDGEPYIGFEPLNGAQQAAVTAIFASIERFTALTFVNATAAGLPAHDAELRFGMTGATDAAHAYTPFHDESAGDTWYSSNGDYDAPRPGNYAYLGFLHEIGHALGLKHPHETEQFGAMPAAHDNMNYTAMSYRSYPGMDLDGPGLTNAEFGFPQTFMMYDIAALQHLYGANFSADGGDSVYKWNFSTGELTVNGTPRVTPGGNVIFMTVWDGGGIDTYDFSNYRYGVTVDLKPGAWSGPGISAFQSYQRADLGDNHRAPGNVANALLYKGDPRSLIENATGGSSDDKLFGNQAANTLKGGGGNDQLDGRSGADRMIGGLGNDWYFADDSGDAIVEAVDGGNDSVHVTAAVYTLAENVENMAGPPRPAATA